MAADLTTTITENVVLNGSVRGSTNTLTTTGIVDVFERILTCTHSQTTTVAVFNSTPHGADGALDVENCKYLRVTNLSDDQDMKVAYVTSATNYQVTVRAGGSHILFQAEEVLIGEEDVCVVCPKYLKLELPLNTRFSLFPMDHTNARSKGLMWNVDGISMNPNGKISTSNENVKSHIEVWIDNGLALAIFPHSVLQIILEQWPFSTQVN